MTDDRELEAALRRVLAAADEPAVTEAAERIALRLGPASLPPQKRAFAWWPAALTNWDFAPAWPRLAMLAGAAVLGLSIGLSGVGTRIAADLDLVRVAAAEDAPTNVLDLDIGIRP